MRLFLKARARVSDAEKKVFLLVCPSIGCGRRQSGGHRDQLLEQSADEQKMTKKKLTLTPFFSFFSSFHMGVALSLHQQLNKGRRDEMKWGRRDAGRSPPRE